MKLLLGRESKDHRLITSVFWVYRFVEEFDFNIEDKVGMIELEKENLVKQFITEENYSPLRQHINDEYRKHVPLLNQIINESNSPTINPVYREIIDTITKDNKKMAHIISSIKSQNSYSDLFVYIPSYIHMFVNRFVCFNSRYTEMLLYIYLSKFYSSKIAKNKYFGIHQN